MRYFIVGMYTQEGELLDKIKVYYKYTYLDKYNKIIDKNKTYTIEEANKIFKNNQPWGFQITTSVEALGKDMIEELAQLEERAEMSFETVNWKTTEEYLSELDEQGYKYEIVKGDLSSYE